MHREVFTGAGGNSLFSSFLRAGEGEEHSIKTKGVKRSQLLMASPLVISLFLSKGT